MGQGDDDDADLRRPASDKVARAVARARIAEKLFSTTPERVRVGRYQLLEKVGAGAMGVVWGAWDPELERRVAIKLLKPELASARERIVREGQALGRLSHPNVVPIYDVGIVDDQVYLVMEWVAGTTLRDWVVEPRSVRDTLMLLCGVGDGIASIHAAGLVHRDVKPDNILVGTDGRARVGDLGLALDGTTASNASAEGTPAYMAPEQIAGEGVDARADQFSLCVCAWEALYGTRPFPDEHETRGAAIERGVAPPARSGVPAYVGAALIRGLAAAPDKRWPSVAALVSALRRDPRAKWRIAALVVGASGVAIAGTALALRDAADPCATGSLAWADTWSAQRNGELHATLGAGPRWRTLAADRVAALLDGYGDRWTRTHHAACSATGSDAVAAARSRALACLDDRRRAVTSAVAALATDNAEVAARASAVIESLAPPEPCGDSQVPVSVPSFVRTAISEQLAQASVATFTGRAREELPRLQALMQQATYLGDPALVAAATKALGSAMFELDDVQGARGILRRAYFLARDAHDAFTAYEAARLLGLSELNTGHVDLADDWSRLAIADASTLDEEERSRALEVAIRISSSRGDVPRSEELLAAITATNTTDPIRIHDARAMVHVLRGHYADAIREYRAAITATGARYGDDSPTVASQLPALATAQVSAGALDEALATRRRAIAISEAAFGRSARRTADALGSYGGTLYHAQRYADATPVLAEAITTLERVAPRSQDLASALNNAGLVAERSGELDTALGFYRRAIVLWTTLYGETYYDIAIIHGNIGLALLNHDRTDEAIVELERSVALWERTDPNMVEIAFPLSTLGAAFNLKRRFADAQRVLERAWKLRDRSDIAPGAKGNTLLELAIAVHNLGDKRRGKELAQRSRAFYLEAKRDDMVAQLDAVIAQM